MLNFIAIISPEKHVSFIYMKTGFTFWCSVFHFRNNYLLSCSHVLACYDYFIFLVIITVLTTEEKIKNYYFWDVRIEIEFFSFIPFFLCQNAGCKELRQGWKMKVVIKLWIQDVSQFTLLESERLNKYICSISTEN